MKKEISAAVILLLLLALAAWNLLYLRNLTDDIVFTLNHSYSLSLDGDWDGAARQAEAANSLWQEAEGYTNVFIRYTAVEYATEAFHNYLTELYRQDAGGTAGTYGKLIAYIENLYEAEQLSLKSFF